METCPFSSTVDSNGLAKIAPCFDSCALKVHGQCAFAVLGYKAWNEAEFGNKKTEASSKTGEEQLQ